MSITMDDIKRSGLRVTIEPEPEPIASPVTRERYHNDVAFARCVDLMMAMIHEGTLTTQDIARAAVLAAQIYAEKYSAPMVVVLREPSR